MKRLAFILVALALTGLGSVGARAGQLCSSPPDDAEATIPLNSEDGAQGDIYVETDAQGIWQEANDRPGLQITPRKTCWSADTRLTPDTADLPKAIPSAVPALPI